MITISTQFLEINEKTATDAEISLPEFTVPPEGLINSLLNYSKSLDVKKSAMMGQIEMLKS